jgi:hypothetical protein
MLLLGLQNDPAPSAVSPAAPAAGDPLSLLHWLTSHGSNVVWLVVLAVAGMSWVSKRLRDWQRKNPGAGSAMRSWVADAQAAARRTAALEAVARQAAIANAAAGPAAQRAAALAAVERAAAVYEAAPAYVPAEATKARQQAQHPHQPRRPSAPPPEQRRAPVLADETAPEQTPRHALLAAFGDPASARTAVVLAEILAPPVGLRRELGGLGVRSS